MKKYFVHYVLRDLYDHFKHRHGSTIIEVAEDKTRTINELIDLLERDVDKSLGWNNAVAGMNTTIVDFKEL